MRSQRLLIAGVLVVALVVVLAVLLPGLSSPQPPGPGPTPTPAPTPAPVPVSGNGTYVNTTYGYAVTCPEGWFYTESGESVWFSSPDKHEEVRVNTNPLSGQGPAGAQKVLETLNATYIEDLRAGIDAEWVSTTNTSLDGVPAYESVFSVPIVEEDRYTFVIRYAVRDNVAYSVMHTVFPPEYDVYNADAAPAAESFRFL
ncbi:PsbP-related protein [Methanoculleus sp.]|uniref:PsbP-related protein n=1 Tax=Methanoculleus sp. TaxID=90427 RepID=UPI001BD504AA|nr:hypothetical protein [Methanoculleus sp.]